MRSSTRQKRVDALNYLMSKFGPVVSRKQILTEVSANAIEYPYWMFTLGKESKTSWKGISINNHYQNQK